MEEGLQGLLMGAVLVMFLITMESALQVVDSSEALEQTVAFAKIFAIVVLPVPLVPQNK